MGSYGPNLPTRFPCWVRAVYSWGGESKNDLGFIEGDLIECLNAGDGSWWMGRLRRDKRMMGLFPSNFVEVMEESFRPASRSPSPMPGMNGGGSISRAASPSPAAPPKQKTTFRKPFQAMRAPSPLPPAATATTSRPASRNNHKQFGLPYPDSTELWNMGPHSKNGSRAPSPSPTKDFGSSPPPPPPPPHRVAVTNRPPPSTPSPSPSMNDRFPTFARTPSPIPPSPTVHGLTPSPLRDAMEDVMSSLKGMGLPQDPPSRDANRSPFNPWSPEAFDQLHTRTPNARPFTSLGLNGGGYEQTQAYSSEHNSPDRYNDGPPQLSNYVERMETRLRQMHSEGTEDYPDEPPAPPPKNSPFHSRPASAVGDRSLRNRRSAYELGKEALGRTFTTKTNSTNSSSGVRSNATSNSTSTNATGQSIMSGKSAGGFSATSAGSFARRNKLGSVNKGRPMTALGNVRHDGLLDVDRSGRPQTPLTGVSYHSSHDSRQGATSQAGWTSATGYVDSSGIFGGLSTPQTKKRGFFKKIMDSAKTGAASARSSIAVSQTGSNASSPTKSRLTNAVTGISGPPQFGRDAAREMGLGGATLDWVQVRRDVNRSNSLSRIESSERADRCAMMDHPVISPVDELLSVAEGDEGHDGLPILEPTDWNTSSLALVDKTARFINSLPPMTNPTSLAQGYVCRPYRSDVQKLRAIFTWVGEKVGWDEDFEGDIDTRRVIQTKRGCSQEMAVLVMEMCSSVGLHAEVVRGYLKTPGEILDLDNLSRPNHWWNAVLVDGEWRIMDCSLASPSNPRRSLYSHAGSQAESWYFLARPSEICYTHVPLLPEQQHICPPIAHDILMALPTSCPPYFKNNLHLLDYNTSASRIESLELVQIQVAVPADVECVATVEAKAFFRDDDGDFFESGDVVRKRALAQADWVNGQKRFTIKALLPSDEGEGVLKVYAGKRGLMHSSKENPHALAFALPIVHTGENPPYDFLLRHPTPHAQKHDLYVLQPQCSRLAINNTFVFAVRQHPSSTSSSSPNPQTPGRVSPNPFARPSSAMSTRSLNSSSTTSNPAHPASVSTHKPAKLAIQAPSGKILRLSRKQEGWGSGKSGAGAWEEGDGTVWETVIKVGERGTWRGLVLADRSARWCVWGEWECF
jgi:transglutaminase/protease-like cytokinesis protein 3